MRAILVKLRLRVMVVLIALLLALVPMVAFAQDGGPVIPGQVDQLLTIALGTVFVTQLLKSIAGSIGGKGSIVVSAVVAVGLTLLSYGSGWSTITAPTCDPNLPIACAQDWLKTGASATALANLMYVLVYSRVFGTTPTPPATTGMVARKGI